MQVFYPAFNICKLQVKAGDSNTANLRNHQIALEIRKDRMGLSTSRSTGRPATSNDDASNNK